MNKYLVILLSTLFYISIISCEKTNTPGNQENVKNSLLEKEIEIKNAINWLNHNSTTTKAYTKWMPMWEDALSFQNDTSKTLEIPLSYLSQDIVSINLSAFKAKTNQEILTTIYKESLIIEANNQSIYRAFFMVVVPSDKSVKNNGKSLVNMTYLYRDRNFDGLVLFKNLEGRIVGGWKYEDGKIIAKLKPSKNKALTKSSITYCQSTYHISWIEWTYSNSYTVDISNIEVWEEINCWTVDNSYSGSGGGSGSEGGGYVDTDDNPSPDDKIKFDAASLPLRSIVEELYRTCGGSNIISSISRSIYITNNTNNSHPLTYAYSINEGHIVSWKNYYPNAQALLHEFVHAMQKEQGITLSDNLNAEIEAFMAYYIFCMSENGFMMSGGGDWTVFDSYLENPSIQNYLSLANFVRNYNSEYSDYIDTPSNRTFDRISNILHSCYEIQISNPN